MIIQKNYEYSEKNTRWNSRINVKMAEERGFEPLHRINGLLAFETSPLNHLGTPPLVLRKHPLKGRIFSASILYLFLVLFSIEIIKNYEKYIPYEKSAK